MRKTKFAAALSLVLAGFAGALDSAQAVSVNPDGSGEALIYPYYTVRSGYDTSISVANTQNEVKAVKVNFLEGKNGRPVLGFSIYLAPFDVWTAAITRTADGAQLTTTDKTCTVPAIPSLGVEFRNIEYAKTDPDGEDSILDRTREGHIVILEMGVITNGTPGDGFTPATAAIHVNGEPRDCSELIGAWFPGGKWGLDPGEGVFYDPETGHGLGGLTGQGTLRNIAQGTSYGYTATALDDFLLLPQHTSSHAFLPNLATGSQVSKINTGNGVRTSDWPSGIDAVSAVLMHDNIINTFVTDANISAGTDWVVTFPTKLFYVEVDDPNDADGVAWPPFTQDFWTGGACEPVGLTIWSREHITPVEPAGDANALCWEANVITFNNTSVLGSQLKYNVNTLAVGENGLMRLSFDAPVL